DLHRSFGSSITTFKSVLPQIEQVFKELGSPIGTIDLNALVARVEKLAPFMAPAGSAAWVDDLGYHGRTASPFPGAELLNGHGQSTVGVGVAAVGVGVLLPSLNRARET